MCMWFPLLHLEKETYTGCSSDQYGGGSAHLHPSPGVGYRNIRLKQAREEP